MDNCLGDGFGGADCSLKDGSLLAPKCLSLPSGGFYCPPSALKNMWMTTQQDMQAFASWCYDVSSETTGAVMKQMRSEIRSRK